MNLFDDQAFAQIPGQLSLETDAPAPTVVHKPLTTREKRERKAERLREWADAREAKQSALDKAARADESATGIPFGQPILVGHHSERRHRRAIERMDRAMGAAVENSRKAQDMAARADGIEAQAAQAIYSDDVDAVERLEAKIAGLEAERERIKAYNASCRKAAKAGGLGDLSLLDEAQRADIATSIRVCAWQVGPGGSMPSYVLSNLGGNITRLRKRLEDLQRPETGRRMTARYEGECRECGTTVERGEAMTYYKRSKSIKCEACS